MKNIKRLALFAMAAVMLSGLTGCAQVPSSSVGIKFNQRTGIASEPIDPSVVPLNILDGETVEIFPLQGINMSFSDKKVDQSDQPGDAIPAKTKEGVGLSIDTTLTFRVPRGSAKTVFETYGTSDMNKLHDLFRILTQKEMRDVASKMGFTNIVATEKPRFTEDVKARLVPVLQEQGFLLDNLFVGDIRRPEEIEQKIQQTLSARQDLVNASSEQKKTQQEAERIIIEAEGQAEQNRLLGAQGGEAAIRLKKLELRKKAIAKWKAAGGRTQIVGEAKIPFSNIQIH